MNDTTVKNMKKNMKVDEEVIAKVYAEIRKLPKRCQDDRPLIKRLHNVMQILGGNEEVFPLDPPWEDTGYVYEGHQVGRIKFCEKSIRLLVMYDYGDGYRNTRDFRIKNELYCKSFNADDLTVGYFGVNEKYELFTSMADWDAYKVALKDIRENPDKYQKGSVGGFFDSVIPAANTKHYAVLGLDPGASTEDIREAYQMMSGLHHPDKGGNPERMKRINTAYESLK